jgi:hypothetical protein
MQVRSSVITSSNNCASVPSARLGHILNNPAVQQNFYDANQAIARPSKLASDPQHARAKEEPRTSLLTKYACHRNQAVWAQAFVLFNVVGIPLSQGVYLEYYFSTALPTSSLSALSIIPALQIACILCMPILVGWFYQWRGQRSGWGIMFFTAAVLAFAAQILLQWIRLYMITMLLQGPLLGAALGTLFSLSSLVLSSHYRFNLPLMSMQSGFINFLKAVVYTLVTRQGLQTRGLGHFSHAATAGITAGTLLTAHLLIRRVKEDELSPNTQESHSVMELLKALAKSGKSKAQCGSYSATHSSSSPSSSSLYTIPLS